MNNKHQQLLRLIIDNEVDQLVDRVVNNSKDLSESVALLKEARVEFGIRFLELMQGIEKKAQGFFTGQKWEAKWAYKTWKEGQVATVTRVTGNKTVILDDLVELPFDYISNNFKRGKG